jgi:predicted DNA-binding transcriptional regulator AlpA
MPKKYLRTNDVAARYSVHPRSVPRMVKDKRLPKPAMYSGRFPLWSEDELDAHDKAAHEKRDAHEKAARETRAHRKAETKAAAP